ncbi:MAG: YafY family protein [Acidimicrobiales bacterium]
MRDTPGRLLRLLSLLQAHRDWTGSELAARLSVSTRTIRSDIDRLRHLGYPVHATSGVAGGYRLGAGAELPPLLLDDEEAVAVAVGLRTAASTSIEGIEETSLRAMAKLEQVLPNRLRRRVNALQTQVEPLRWGTAHATVDPESLAVLSQACRDGEQIRFDYSDKSGAETRRLVEPYRLVPTGHRWYLVAFDLRRDDWRTFRVDRAAHPRRAGGRSLRRALPATDAAEFVRQSLSSMQTSHDVVVVLHAAADEVAGRIHPSTGTVESIDGFTCRLRASGDSIEWLAFRIASLGLDFTVESPPEFVDHLSGLGRRITRAAQGS